MSSAKRPPSLTLRVCELIPSKSSHGNKIFNVCSAELILSLLISLRSPRPLRFKNDRPESGSGIRETSVPPNSHGFSDLTTYE
jgi:hypothetical protein